MTTLTFQADNGAIHLFQNVPRTEPVKQNFWPASLSFFEHHVSTLLGLRLKYWGSIAALGLNEHHLFLELLT